MKVRAIPHNSKCRYGERGAADAKPKAQIILDVLSSKIGINTPPCSKVIDFLRGERYDTVVIKKKASFVRTPLLTPFSFSLSNRNSSTARG